MLDKISRRILTDPVSRRSPHYVALAYWLRRASLTRLVEVLSSKEQDGHLIGARGVTLHLPPTNVDTIFVYSWAMSVLAGNPNVVRLPEMLSSETSWLVELVTTVVAECGEADRQIFCRYPYGEHVEVAVASHFDLRIIWGGDEKILAVSRIPIRPDGISVGFPDRKSLALISSQAYAMADEAQRNTLAEQFYNDVYWFNQMGCGSPRLILWFGEPGAFAADFYERVAVVACRKGFSVEAGVSISKLSLSHDLLAEQITSKHSAFGSALNVSRVIDPLSALNRPHGGGFLCDMVLHELAELWRLADRSLQTVTHFGLSSSELAICGEAMRGRGGYRLVPIGQALQFGAVWDGVDLYEHMTRRIVIRA